MILLGGSSLLAGCIEWGPFPSDLRCTPFFLEGKYEEAIKACTKEISAFPDSAERYHTRGMAYSNRGKLDEAIVDYDKAIRLDPRRSDYYEFRGIAFYRKKSFDQAISDFDRAIGLKPDSLSAYLWRGICFFEQGFFERARGDFQTVAKGNPDYPGLDYWLGMAGYQLGRYEEAARAFESGARKPGGETLGFWAKKARAANALGMQVSRAEDGIRVERVTRGGGADLGGILAGDVLVEFHGERLAGMSPDQFMNLAAEKPGNTPAVRVKVLRSGSALEKSILMEAPPGHSVQSPQGQAEGLPSTAAPGGVARNLPKIAVWDLVPREVRSAYAQELTSILASEINRLRKYEVYSQENVRTLAGWTEERMKLGCTSTQCLTALGQMEVAKLISGSVAKIGTRYSVSLNLFDTQNARSENSISEFCQSEDELIELVQGAARKLLQGKP